MPVRSIRAEFVKVEMRGHAIVLTHVIACMLHNLLQMLLLLLQYFIQGLSHMTLRIYLAVRHYYGHVAAMCILYSLNTLYCGGKPENTEQTDFTTTLPHSPSVTDVV